MIRKIYLRLEEIIIPQAAPNGIVPGNIHIIPLAIQLYDIPGMGFSSAIACNISGLYSRLLAQPLEQAGIALAYCSAPQQSRIGTVAKIGSIIHIGGIADNIIMDQFDPVIVSLSRQAQTGYHLCHSPGNLSFLLAIGSA